MKTVQTQKREIQKMVKQEIVLSLVTKLVDSNQYEAAAAVLKVIKRMCHTDHSLKHTINQKRLSNIIRSLSLLSKME